MTIRAPPSREGFPTAFPVTVTGTLATQSGTASDRVTFQNQLAAAPPPPPPPEFPWIPVLGVALLLAIAGAFGAMTWRREGGIELAAKAAEQDARPGADTFVPLEIRNTSGRPRVARVTAEGLPPGWTAATNRDEIPLDPGQSEPLWLAVRPPAGAEAGLTTVSILAKPREAKKARQATKVRIKVVPEAGVSGQDFVRPSFLPSDRPPGA